MAEEIINGENAQFYKHLFLHMDYKNQRKMSPELMHAKQVDGMRFLEENVNYDLLKINADQPEALRILFHELMTTVFQSIAAYYLQQESDHAITIEQVQERFELVLGWLETGASKQG